MQVVEIALGDRERAGGVKGRAVPGDHERGRVAPQQVRKSGQRAAVGDGRVVDERVLDRREVVADDQASGSRRRRPMPSSVCPSSSIVSIENGPTRSLRPTRRIRSQRGEPGQESPSGAPCSARSRSAAPLAMRSAARGPSPPRRRETTRCLRRDRNRRASRPPRPPVRPRSSPVGGPRRSPVASRPGRPRRPRRPRRAASTTSPRAPKRGAARAESPVRAGGVLALLHRPQHTVRAHRCRSPLRGSAVGASLRLS